MRSDTVSLAEKIAVLRRLEQNSQDERETQVLTTILNDLHRLCDKDL